MKVIVVAGTDAGTTSRVCQWAGTDTECHIFHEPQEAIAYASAHTYDLILLDVQMSCIEEMRDWMEVQGQRQPILLVDSKKIGETDFSTNVWSLKPVLREDNMFTQTSPARMNDVLLYVQCFGNFEVFQKDRTRLRFKRKKSKELFAYLILRRGAACSNAELAGILFEDDCYDTKRQQYLQKIIASLRETLEEAGAGDVLVRSYGNISVDVNKVQCDYYQFTHNDTEVLRSWAGEFMLQYSWAEPMAGYISNISGTV